MRRGGERIDDDWRFLALKLVDGADAGTREAILNLEHLRVVGRDD